MCQLYGDFFLFSIRRIGWQNSANCSALLRAAGGLRDRHPDAPKFLHERVVQLRQLRGRVRPQLAPHVHLVNFGNPAKVIRKKLLHVDPICNPIHINKAVRPDPRDSKAPKYVFMLGFVLRLLARELCFPFGRVLNLMSKS